MTALQRIETQALYQQMFAVEPDLYAILNVAVSQPPDRDHWKAYIILKQMCEPLVGFDARQPELRTSRHYEAMMQAIDELLPMTPEYTLIGEDV